MSNRINFHINLLRKINFKAAAITTVFLVILFKRVCKIKGQKKGKELGIKKSRWKRLFMRYLVFVAN
jgi:hypothetical protein